MIINKQYLQYLRALQSGIKDRFEPALEWYWVWVKNKVYREWFHTQNQSVQIRVEMIVAVFFLVKTEHMTEEIFGDLYAQREKIIPNHIMDIRKEYRGLDQGLSDNEIKKLKEIDFKILNIINNHGRKEI